ncbi:MULTISPECIES: helix-turn-helix transcriptional regulator [unclassified Coleofasciculus]|uniref:helix-turn-helix transcriptional regulator n=1 Tax=unclassified Coleofasciculus TaxID=2692782 RepID=UPI00188239B8|nr:MULTISPECIES: LuxR C-terminal-related transcriptional regulator [unclassified Coleofasciculus]MBE9127777.1 LuxR family transcriptional regulator [Coleofasciculus sp. LEGE 07081]MBE9148588.1 LuxR family transcriptional regulator [Coleofasciculus sp. LEGE 07092]
MTNSLHTLFQAIADARDEQELRLHLMDALGKHFDAQYWGLCLLNEESQSAEVQMQGGSDSDGFVERYNKLGRRIDPVLRYVIEHHAPAHEALVLSPEVWKQSELYQNCYAHYDHEHIMMGPIISGGRLMGGVYFARASEEPAFDYKDLADLTGLCLHLSSRLATLRSQPPKPKSLAGSCLTPREREIAELVAKGLTNAQIGAELWITQNSVKQALKRMFRKLNVSARAELVARLQNS